MFQCQVAEGMVGNAAMLVCCPGRLQAQVLRAGGTRRQVFRRQMQVLRAQVQVHKGSRAWVLRGQVLRAQVQVHRGSGGRCAWQWRQRVGGREDPPGRSRRAEQRKSL